MSVFGDVDSQHLLRFFVILRVSVLVVAFPPSVRVLVFFCFVFSILCVAFLLGTRYFRF